jgi:hypothetical protein
MPDSDRVNDAFSFFQPTSYPGDLTALPAPTTTNQVHSSPPAAAHLVPTANILSSLDGSKCFTEICEALNIDMNLAVEPARYTEVNSKQPDALLVMVLNHQAMPQLLVCLGQPDYKLDPQATNVTTYSGGLTVSSHDIILELGWTQVSYAHKSNWYGWAASAASASWTSGLSGGMKRLLEYTDFDYSGR